MRVFVLVDVQPGEEKGVLSSLYAIEEVEEAAVIFGQYDLIVKVVCGAREEAIDIVRRKIRTISGVRGMLTLIPIYGFER